MNDKIFRYSRISLSIFFTFVALGVISWFTMPREEDPRLKKRFGNIQVTYPGATAEEAHRLVIQPLEDELSRIDEIKSIDATARADFAYVEIELKASVSSDVDINRAWDDIETATERARRDFPSVVLPPLVNRDALDQDAVVVAVLGGQTMDDQLRAMQELEDEFLATPLVASVNRLADPGESIRIDVNEEKLEELGLDLLVLAQRLRGANQSTPSGTLRFSGKQLTLQTNASFRSIEDVKRYAIKLSNGETVLISDIAEVYHSIQLPRTELFRWNGKEGIALGVVPQAKINLIQFGKNVQATLERFQPHDETLQIEVVSFQPGNVKERIAELSRSLLIGIGIIALALLLTIGFRIGLLAAILVPSISLVALSFFAFQGGVLQQISIAAFVVSLGLLVDNVIVVLESVQDGLDRQLSPLESAKSAIRQLALPLTAATGTTIAAFLPMLGSAGTTADFTRSIPLVVVLGLMASFFVALFVTPVLAKKTLRAGGARNWQAVQGIFAKLGLLVSRRPGLLLFLSVLLVVISASFFPKLRMQFFPSADRNQLVVDMQLPEGTHFQVTQELAARVEKFLIEKDRIDQVASFIGRGTPRFFYNLNNVLNSPHVAQMIVVFEDFNAARELKSVIQGELDQFFPEALILVRDLNQGPPTKAPIEYRITGKNLDELFASQEKLVRLLREIPGTTKVRSTLGAGSPVMRFSVDDANASQYGIDRSSVGNALFARSRGLEIGSFRFGEETYPIVLSNSRHEDLQLSDLQELQMSPTRTEALTLARLASAQLRWEPALIQTRDGLLITQVFSELEDGYGYNQIIGRVQERLGAAADPSLSPARIELDGAAAESEEANTAILKVIPLGALLLLISLLIQFNSFAKVLVVFGAVLPIWIGIVPGLLLTNLPFGFFSLLAVLALVGIVVNNGILLVDQIDRSLEEGLDLPAAVQESIRRRSRPIILTTLTTVLGLLPLAFTSATLWPPFAWTMIFGLFASMIFTPIVVPSIYVLIFSKKSQTVSAPALATVLVLLWAPAMSLFSPSVSEAQSDYAMKPPTRELKVTWEEMKALVENHPRLGASDSEINERGIEKDRIEAGTFLPQLSLGASHSWRDQEVEIVTPIGNFGGTGTEQSRAEISLRQPLYRPGQRVGEARSAGLEQKSLQQRRQRTLDELMAQAMVRFAEQGELQERWLSNERYIRKLQRQKREVQRLLDLGQVTEVDELRVNLALSDAQTASFRLQKDLVASRARLGQALGLSASATIVPPPSAENWVKTWSQGLNLKAEVLEVIERPDLEELEWQEQALAARQTGIQRSYLPQLDLQGAARWEDPTANNTDTTADITLQLSWAIWNGNQRSYEKRKLSAQRSALRSQIENQKQLIRAERTFYQTQLQTLLNEWPAFRRDFLQAQKVVTLEEDRYSRGKSTLNELLDAEFILRENRERQRTQPYRILSAWAQYQLSLGEVSASLQHSP